MAIDSIREVRRAMLTILKQDAAVTALVPASQLYPQTAPANHAWPFGAIGSPSGIPIVGTCLDGQEITVAVHGFAKPREASGAILESAEDHASRIGAAFAKALDRRKAVIPGGRMTIAWRGSQLLRDGDEAGAFHCVVNFRIRCHTN